MKGNKSKSSGNGADPLPYRLSDLVLFPTLLTVVAAVIAFFTALSVGGPEIYGLVVGCVLVLAIIFYSITFLIGGLGLILFLLRRGVGRMARSRDRRHEQSGTLRDEWVDGL